MLEDKHNLNGARNITILDNKRQPKKRLKRIDMEPSNVEFVDNK